MEFILHQSIIPFLSQKYMLNTQIIKATVLHAGSIGESMVDELIEDLEKKSNPTVGLLAHPGQVDIRVTSKAESELEASYISKPIVQEIKMRLGNHIYGQDEETLEFVISNILNQHRLKLRLMEYGLDGKLTERLKLVQLDAFSATILEDKLEDVVEFENKIEAIQNQTSCDIWFCAALNLNDNNKIHLYFKNSSFTEKRTRKYGGPKEYIPLWAQNISLDFLRRQLMKGVENY
jgi:hypothetical protein